MVAIILMRFLKSFFLWVSDLRYDTERVCSVRTAIGGDLGARSLHVNVFSLCSATDVKLSELLEVAELCYL